MLACQQGDKSHHLRQGPRGQGQPWLLAHLPGATGHPRAEPRRWADACSYVALEPGQPRPRRVQRAEAQRGGRCPCQGQILSTESWGPRHPASPTGNNGNQSVPTGNSGEWRVTTNNRYDGHSSHSAAGARLSPRSADTTTRSGAARVPPTATRDQTQQSPCHSGTLKHEPEPGRAGPPGTAGTRQRVWDRWAHGGG